MVSSVWGTLATIASLIFTLSLVDQVRTNYQRKSCKGFSPLVAHVGLVAYLCWVLHGLEILNPYLLIAKTFGLLITAILVYQFYRLGPMPSSKEFWNKLLGFLKPDIMVDRFTDITLFGLNPCGSVRLILDIDNTLALPNSKKVIQAIVDMLRNAKIRGDVKEIVLVSNVVVLSTRRKWRIMKIARQIRARGFVCAVLPHIKPSPVPIRRALAMMPGAIAFNTVVIGDQLFTDGLAAKRAGLRFILVKPLGGERIYTSWKRVIERLVFWLTGWQ